MRHIRLLVAAAAFAAAGLTGFAAPLKFGPVNCKLSYIQQNIDGQSTSSTNKTGSSTNITQTSLYTTQTTTINNNQLLDMLANSFSTNWPAGAALKLDEYGDFDVVKGSTIVQDVSSVLSVATSSNTVYSGTIVNTTNENSSISTQTQKYTQTASASLVYDDSAHTTANGNTTRITVNGIQTMHTMISSTVSGETFNYVYSFIGTGTGSISNTLTDTPLIVGGTFSATESNR